MCGNFIEWNRIQNMYENFIPFYIMHGITICYATGLLVVGLGQGSVLRDFFTVTFVL